MNILVKKEKRVATLNALRPFYVCIHIIRCTPYIYNKVSNYASATSSLILRPITR